MTLVTTVKAPVRSVPSLNERYVGKSVLRVEDPSLLTGRSCFVDDIDLPDQLYARIVRSNVAHGNIIRLSVDDALRHEGVVGVFTGEDVDPSLRVPVRMHAYGNTALALQPPLAQGVVRYVGEPVAVVLAVSPYVAEDAAEDVWTEIEELPVILDARQSASVPDGDEAVLHPPIGTNVLGTVRAAYGSVGDIFESAPVVVTECSGVHRHSAAPMETRGILAAFDRDVQVVTIWGGTKVKHWNKGALAALLGLDPHAIRLIETDIGGGFGVRGELYPEDVLIPWLAMRLHRPVKWIEDRAEHLVAANHSRQQSCEMAMAATEDGRLLGFRATAWIDLGAYCRTHGLLLPYNTALHMAGPYDWAAFEVTALGVLTNKTPAGTFRGPGQFEPTFHRERLLDRLAAKLGMDALDLRKRNLISRRQMPRDIDIGLREHLVFNDEDFDTIWDRLQTEAGVEELRRSIGMRRARGELVGMGTCTYIEASGGGLEEWARVAQENDGRYRVTVGISALGQGIITTLSQVAAEGLGVPIKDVTIHYEDTDEVTDGGGAFNSRGAVFGANAILGAIRALHVNALGAASGRLGVPEGTLAVTATGVHYVPGGQNGDLSFAELGVEGAFRFERAGRTFAMGATVAVASVDSETGSVSVERVAVGCDVGWALNPTIVEGQVRGAAAQGISGTLYEKFAYDTQGQPLSTSFIDYSLASAKEVPTVETCILESARPSAPGGLPRAGSIEVRGAGEVGIIGVGAALANAVADALGTGAADELTSLPLSAEAVRSAIGAHGRRRTCTHE